MSRTAELHELQLVDSALDSRMARIRDIDEQTALNEELEAARVAHEEAQARYVQAQSQLKECSREAEETSTRIKTQEKRLYDGSIKNPKELGQIGEEVGHLKVRFKQLEESVIEAMLAVEEAGDEAQKRAEELEAVSQEWEQSKAGLLEERDKLLTQAKVLKVKRQRAVTTLPWADLQMYERLRRSKGGIAVAEVKGGLCGGCRVGVPAHVLRLARSTNDLVTCPTCGRVLFPVGEIKFSEFDHDLDNVDR
jgi:predicted  nucleic acid-binding Zn-ribbon protein